MGMAANMVLRWKGVLRCASRVFDRASLEKEHASTTTAANAADVTHQSSTLVVCFSRLLALLVSLPSYPAHLLYPLLHALHPFAFRVLIPTDHLMTDLDT
jgi:hypothetical protein